jgi:hypothetical protein
MLTPVADIRLPPTAVGRGGRSAMAKMTPEQEAAYALNFGVSRSDLRPQAQAEYDRLLQERQEGNRTRQTATVQQSMPDAEPGDSANCSVCGEELTPNARFCAACGEPASKDAQNTHCSGCGEELTPNAQFCAACGEPVRMRQAKRASAQNSASQSSSPEEAKLQEFTVKYVTFYDGSGHRLGPSECTLTSRRLIISDVRGGIHQILLRDIAGISMPSKLAAPKMLRISLPGLAYDIDCISRDQKNAIEVWLGQAIRNSFG